MASEAASGIDFRFVESNGVKLHVAGAGPEDGPLLLLLHGFPEFWYGWRNQIAPLAEAGFRVWAPDGRGYNLSDKPRGVRAYGVDELAADVVGLIDAADQRAATVVGHDWGGGVAWWVAKRFPDRVRRLVILNCPHPAVMERRLRRSLRQLMRSWYMFFFQLPWLPEATARWTPWWWSALRRSSRPGTFTDEDRAEYRAAWSQPGALRGMVNWYRAALRARPAPPADARIAVPTLLIWGTQDRFLGREMAEPSIELCDEGRLVFLDEATHWVQHEEPQRVSELIAEFARA